MAIFIKENNRGVGMAGYVDDITATGKAELSKLVGEKVSTTLGWKPAPIGAKVAAPSAGPSACPGPEANTTVSILGPGGNAPNEQVVFLACTPGAMRQVKRLADGIIWSASNYPNKGWGLVARVSDRAGAAPGAELLVAPPPVVGPFVEEKKEFPIMLVAGLGVAAVVGAFFFLGRK